MCVYNMHAHAFGAYRNRVGTVILTLTHAYMQLVKKKKMYVHTTAHIIIKRGVQW